MQDRFVDVLLEVPTRELTGFDDPTQELYERMRVHAVRECRERGARIDAGLGPVEIRVQEARSSFLGDMTLVASRWALIP